MNEETKNDLLVAGLIDVKALARKFLALCADRRIISCHGLDGLHGV